MATDYMIQPYALRRESDDEKFGFSLKAQASQDGSLGYLVISSVVPGSPADRAGLTVDMTVVDINGVPLISGTTKDAARAIGLTQAGRPLMMGIKVDMKKGLRRSEIPTLPSMVLPHQPQPARPVSMMPLLEATVVSPPVKPAVPPKPPRQSVTTSTPRPSIAASMPRQSIPSTPIDTNDAIIIDNGAGYCKIGLATQTAPIVFPTISGRHKLAGIGVQPAIGMKPFYGTNAFNKKGILKLTYPYERGVIKNWEDMTAIWEYAFKDELRIEPKDRSVLITEPIFTSKDQREKMAEIMFETFEVLSLHMALSSLLGMYAAGYTNNTLVVDIGDSLTQVVPIRNDFNVAFLACQKYSLAGSDVSERLSQLLSGETGHTFSAQDFNLREIKEKLGGVAPSTFAAETPAIKQKFTLPDGNVIDVGNERFLCTEVLFDPGRVGMTSAKSIQEAVLLAVQKCDNEAPVLLQNVVICGGSTMFPGFAERLQSEVKALTPQFFGRSLDVKVSTERNGKLASWLGGVSVAKVAGFQNQWIRKQEFIEYGSSIVHRKAAPI